VSEEVTEPADDEAGDDVASGEEEDGEAHVEEEETPARSTPLIMTMKRKPPTRMRTPPKR
jgi:hypothetical protein